MRRSILLVKAALLCALMIAGGGSGKADEAEAPRLSLFIGVDISGSFMKSGYYDDAIDFLSRYIYAHLNGLGGLEIPNVLFVGSIGGVTPDQAKTLYPRETFEHRSVDEIAQKLRDIFPRGKQNPITDFNAFVDQVAMTVKNRKLVLRPISVVLISDGVPDVPSEGGSDYRSIRLQPLESLSRNITVRLLYTSAEVGKNWQTKVRRSRVKVWTQDAAVMVSWKDPRIYIQAKPVEDQPEFYSWVKDNVDFGVSARRVD
ncbi:MAG TPA: hypothetical protein VK569_09215 [Bacteroidota bacterium]|nr:hypothetical protein [Bacteroidota bacterium]